MSEFLQLGLTFLFSLCISVTLTLTLTLDWWPLCMGYCQGTEWVPGCCPVMDQWPVQGVVLTPCRLSSSAPPADKQDEWTWIHSFFLFLFLIFSFHLNIEPPNIVAVMVSVLQRNWWTLLGGSLGGFGFGWGGWCSGFTVVIFPDKMYVNRGAGLYITVLLRGMRACVRRVSRYLINPVSQSVWLFINACTLSTHLIKPPFNGIKLQNWTCFTAAVVVSGNWTLICMIHMEVMWKHTTMTTHLPHNRLVFFFVYLGHMLTFDPSIIRDLTFHCL